jgi:SET domain-containing protein
MAMTEVDGSLPLTGLCDAEMVVGVRVLREVAAGEELLVDYGEGYWNGQ